MLDRRSMMKGAGATIGAAISARSYARIRGANDRVRVAVVGVNSRGRAHVAAFSKVPNVAITHVVDCDSQILATRAAQFAENGVADLRTERDYRRLLDADLVDIVTVATPDHSHAKISVDALDAGHHVYCEKPIGLAPAEGEAMIAAQRRTGRQLQVGNQQRSSPETRRLRELVREGELGEVYEAQTWYALNRQPIGPRRDAEPPASLDWDLWQGPRPRRRYQTNLVPYNWHWTWAYGTGEICNNGMHEIDIARWLMGLGYPQRVTAQGARAFFENWEMYDSMALTLGYRDGRTIRWDGQSGNGMPRYGRGRGVLLLGTKGSAIVDRNGFETYDLGGEKRRDVKAAATSETTGTVGEGVLDIYHAANLVDVIRGRASDLASPIAEGHVSTTICHLGNMAWRTGRPLAIDADTGHADDAEAMRLWSVDYEPGWELGA